MHVAIRIFWVLGIGLLAQNLALLFVTFKFLRYMRRSRSRPLNNFTPPVALIIPCKGLETDFESNLSSYLCQDYPHYQVIFVVASVDDPAYQALRTRLEKVSSHKQNKEVETVGPQERPPCYGDSKDRENGGIANGARGRRLFGIARRKGSQPSARAQGCGRQNRGPGFRRY